jgi:ParB family transcriptional regulator, chromosome partitioning protein
MTNALKSSIARLSGQLDSFKKGAAYTTVSLDTLQPYAKQSRTTFDAQALAELAATIKELGVLEPLLVRPLDGGKYEIIAGERRARAARIAGLSDVPVLVKTLNDEETDKIHLYENIHRENLSSLDLAQRVEKDIQEAGGSLIAVALKYGKTKSWVSKLSTIARGGDVMADVVESGASSDRAVLSTVAALERKSPEAAKELGKRLKAAGSTANKRSIAEEFAKASKAAKAEKASKPARFPRETQVQDEEEPDWRQRNVKSRAPASMLVMLELSPHSRYADEFARMSKKYGAARLAVDARHPSTQYVLVEFGDTGLQRRMYAAQELRLLSVA